MDQEPLYLYILSRLPLRQLIQFENIRHCFGSFRAAFEASDKDLLNLGWSSVLLDQWNKIKLNFSIDALVDSLEKNKVGILPYYDPLYPKLLKEIFDAPSVLFYRGNLIDGQEACIAIVGTRQISSYGRAILPRFTDPLINSKVTIISGLAYGVDAAAHTEAINKNVRTIGVLGSGLDQQSLYPRQHLRLAEHILNNNGLLLSEHPPGMPAFKQNFIARNRIIAGIALGTIIPECKTKSGALITADYAIDFNRPVYAVPGPIYSPFSEGPNKLIKDGAMLVSSGKEVLEDLNLQVEEVIETTKNFSVVELRVLKCMQTAPLTIDALQNELKISTEELISSLTSLELQSAVKSLGAAGFIKT